MTDTLDDYTKQAQMHHEPQSSRACGRLRVCCARHACVAYQLDERMWCLCYRISISIVLSILCVLIMARVSSCTSSTPVMNLCSCTSCAAVKPVKWSQSHASKPRT
jgi:hypothetical protein